MYNCELDIDDDKYVEACKSICYVTGFLSH